MRIAIFVCALALAGCSRRPQYQWTFESGTTEGWTFDPSSSGPTSPFTGVLASDPALHASGARALAIGFKGNGTGKNNALYLKAHVADGPGVDLRPKTLHVKVRLMTRPGTTPLDSRQAHFFGVYHGTSELWPVIDFSVHPPEGGCEPIKGPCDVERGWLEIAAPLSGYLDQAANATDVGFRFLIDSPWEGTIYLDDMSLQ